MTSETLLLMLFVVNDKPFATMLHSSGSGSSSTQSVLLLPMLDDGKAMIEVMLMSVDEAGELTRHTSHVTRHTSHVTRHTSLVTRLSLPTSCLLRI